MTSRPLVIATLALAGTLTWANGSVVTEGWQQGGPVVPRQETTVRLEREDLELTQTPDRGYEIDATYTLSNPGPAKAIQYGVPLMVHRGIKEPGSQMHPDPAAAREAARAFARQVRISLGEQTTGCRPQEDLMSDGTFLGWCVTPLTVPTGASVLHLHYVLEGRGNRGNLSYPLQPATSWAGGPIPLPVRLHKGPYTLTRAPPGAKVEGDLVVWQFAKADFNAMPWFKVETEQSPVFAIELKPEMEDWKEKLSARASSALKEGRWTHAAAHLIDLDEKTAWCVRTEKYGVGEWAEISIDNFEELGPSSGLTCVNQGEWLILAGYAKNQGTWANNGRVVKLGLRECGEGGEALGEVSPRVPEEIITNPGAALIHVPLRKCVRFEILGVDGPPGDTCISTLLPTLHCARPKPNPPASP